MRVVAAMSGGVDSSVAAARLVAAGHDVLGVHLGLHAGAGAGCAKPVDVAVARSVAARLGIGFEVWDLAAEFRREVVAHFLDGYRAGLTPNPCLHCNAVIKFGALLDEAARRGLDAVGTGHYARVDPAGPALFRARDVAKDQSYVLSVLPPDRLRRCLFPLGDVAGKADVRAEATALGLGDVAARPDSLDICFIPDGDTAGYLRRELGEAPGPIVDEVGVVVGGHTGTHQFTIGQRRGLRLGSPAPGGKPRYVLALRPAERTVVVGPAAAGRVSRLVGADANWLVPAAGRPALVQVRAHGTPLPGYVVPDGAGLVVELDEPTAGVAPGQGLVAYDGDRVLVSATVTSAS